MAAEIMMKNKGFADALTVPRKKQKSGKLSDALKLPEASLFVKTGL